MISDGRGRFKAGRPRTSEPRLRALAPAGRLATRTWARLDLGQPLTAAHLYDPDTGELTGIDYADDTPDVAFTYDRLGRIDTVTDAAGTRTFGYDPATLVPNSETLTGLVEAVLTRTQETTGVPGRPEGFHLGSGHEVSRGYEPDTGRLASVWWSVNATPDSASYTYLAQSGLLETRLLDGDVLTTYGYDPERNLLTQVKHEVGTARVAQYDCTHTHRAASSTGASAR